MKVEESHASSVDECCLLTKVINSVAINGKKSRRACP
jgi:hypothetical protein